MNGCVFCEIVAGRARSYKVWEDSDFLAILDVFPKISGQVLLVAKKHLPSYVFGLTKKEQSAFFGAAAKVGRLMDKKLGTARTAMRMEGLEVEHAHLKLYPVYSREDYGRNVNNVPQRVKSEELEIIYKKFLKGGEN